MHCVMTCAYPSVVMLTSLTAAAVQCSITTSYLVGLLYASMTREVFSVMVIVHVGRE